MLVISGLNGITATFWAANGAESRWLMPPVPHRYARADLPGS